MREKIIFIHGISAQTTGYSDTLYSAVLNAYAGKLKRAGLSSDRISARLAEFSQHEIMWADTTGPDVSKYLQAQYGDRPGFWTWAQKRIDPLVAQLGIYTRDKAKGGPILARIQESFEQALADKPDRITVIGHSLGSVIAWDYLMGWQENFKLPQGVKVRAFITMGSPISLFSVMQRHPVSPDMRMPENIGKWVNLIDPDDGIARFCQPHFSADIVRDVLVSTGFWMLLSHCGYWKSRGVARAIAEALD